MPDELNAAAAGSPPAEAPTATAVDDPNLVKAMEHGYVEPAPVSHQERAMALVESFEHAAANNAPVTPAMLAELRAVLLG